MSERVEERYTALIEDVRDIYDGDTIERVHLKLEGLFAHAGTVGEVFPDVFARDGEVWVKTNVRIAGIDAPELHPHHRDRAGNVRTVASLASEHAAAMKARDVVATLLRRNGLQFEIRNPLLGKYAGRTVAEVWVPDTDGTFVNVSDVLLERGLAYPYDGGTKTEWDARPQS